MTPRFTLADAERASDEWGCNCGPAALAAVTGRTLDEIRPLMGDFEKKRYTNPTLMRDSLKRTGVKFCWNIETIPTFGLIRVQWEGPWNNPGVPARVAYRHTHWIGIDQPDGAAIARLATGNDGHPETPHPGAGIFDVNALNNGTGWLRYHLWATILVPWILEQCEPKADGCFSFTHFVEVDRPQEPKRCDPK